MNLEYPIPNGWRLVQPLLRPAKQSEYFLSMAGVRRAGTHLKHVPLIIVEPESEEVVQAWERGEEWAYGRPTDNSNDTGKHAKGKVL